MHANIQLPPELVDIIITEFWYSEHPSSDRIAFMTACPLINSVWRDVYARITSRDVYVPKVAYLLYLSSIILWNDSPIYGCFPSNSTRTITCYVDLTHSGDDAAKDPYSVFCSLPNYLGFRLCFPNIEQINLEMKFRIGWYCSSLSPSHQLELFRTRVSIELNHATSQLSVLPAEWSVAVHCPPDVKDVYLIKIAQIYRRSILTGVTMDMVQCCYTLSGGIRAAIKRSTYHHGAHHFHKRFGIQEKRGDVRDININLGTQRHWRWSWNFKNILSEIYGILYFISTVCSHDAIERHSWEHVLARAAMA
ncbi:hypothetical protein EDD85DRAFT_74167 [Armillaria nabsnona]|nr:hypothetical protein EDD85DRAFT_74167 [Armillaria nabsnona]